MLKTTMHKNAKMCNYAIVWKKNYIVVTCWYWVRYLLSYLTILASVKSASGGSEIGTWRHSHSRRKQCLYRAVSVMLKTTFFLQNCKCVNLFQYKTSLFFMMQGYLLFCFPAFLTCFHKRRERPLSLSPY